MSQNDFFVAIQGILTQANESGWTVDQTYQYAIDAVEEWLEETQVVSNDVDEGK